jgi:hypothetical protein
MDFLLVITRSLQNPQQQKKPSVLQSYPSNLQIFLVFCADSHWEVLVQAFHVERSMGSFKPWGFVCNLKGMGSIDELRR